MSGSSAPRASEFAPGSAHICADRRRTPNDAGLEMTTAITRIASVAALILGLAAQSAVAQTATPQSSAKKDTATKAQADPAPRIEIYGFAQADAIGDFNTNNPDWFDVNRPSKLPAFQ